MSLRNFNKAYNSVIKDSRSILKLGAYRKVGDYRDVVNDACLKLIKKYGEELYTKSPKEIAGLIVHSIKWVRHSKMRTKKDLSSEFFTNYISEFENFDVTFRSDWLHDVELRIDADLNKLPDLVTIVEGFNSKDYIDRGIYKSKRVALYQTQKQIDKYKKIYEQY